MVVYWLAMQALSTKVPMAWFYVTLPSNSVLMSQVTGEPTHSLGLGCGVCVCVCVCVCCKLKLIQKKKAEEVS